MSGYKRATIAVSEEEYRRLHDADMKLRFAQKESANAVSRENVEQMLNALFEQFAQRQERFDQCMESLGNEIGEMESRAAQMLVMREAELLRERRRDIEDIQDNMTNAMDALSKEIRDQIVSGHERLESGLRNVDIQLTHIEDERRQKYALAETWIQSAGVLSDFIEQQYEHDRFAPGYFDGYNQELQLANENYQRGMPEAALLGAQQAYLHFSALRLSLEQLTNEWQLSYQTALKAANRLRLLVNINSACSALDAQGCELPVRIKLEDWSKNNYLKLVGRIESILDRLERRRDDLQTTQLRDLAVRILPGLEKELDSMIYQARLAVINSQLRINIAAIALRALEEQGFILDGAGYVEDDKQNAYRVGMRNIEGSNVIIRVDPMSDADQTNALVVESQDLDQRTEYELKRRSQEIFNALLQHGLRAGPVHASVETRAERTAVFRDENIPERERKRFGQIEHDRTD